MLVAPKNYHKNTCAFLLLQSVTIAAGMIIIKQRTHIIIEESKGMMMDADGSACSMNRERERAYELSEAGEGQEPRKRYRGRNGGQRGHLGGTL